MRSSRTKYKGQRRTAVALPQLAYTCFVVIELDPRLILEQGKCVVVWQPKKLTLADESIHLRNDCLCLFDSELLELIEAALNTGRAGEDVNIVLCKYPFSNCVDTRQCSATY